jgi:hypothetical protein
LHARQTATEFDIRRNADPIIENFDDDFTITGVRRDIYGLCLSVSQRVGDALLQNPVNGLRKQVTDVVQAGIDM